MACSIGEVQVDDDDFNQSTTRVAFKPEVEPEGETEWYVSKATAKALKAQHNDLSWVKGDRFAPRWIREWHSAFTISVVEED